ncbi:hypothetical protein [Pelagicoccus mobilis]|nr:hypothetical protein [Pelagicoccus mobilis]
MALSGATSGRDLLMNLSSEEGICSVCFVKGDPEDADAASGVGV